MSKAVWFISYKLKEGSSVSDFLAASKKCHDEVLSLQKGFISWEVLAKEDTWVDFVTWETKEDAKNGETAGGTNPAARDFYSFIDFKTIKTQEFSIEKSY